MSADDLVGIEADADRTRMIEGGEIPETKWAPLLADMLRVLEARFVRNGVPAEEAFKRAADVVLAISEYFGGRSVYLPKGEQLAAALRHAAIWRKFNGRNVPELAAEFELSEIHVYAVLKAQRALAQRKLQGRLFQE